MADKILVVPGYEVNVKLRVPLGLTRSVCDYICAYYLHRVYRHILLIGGWHLLRPDPEKDDGRPTIAEVMKEYLVQGLILERHLFTQFDLGLEGRRPSRDTMEEIDSLPYFFAALGHSQPRQVEFDIVCPAPCAARWRYLCRLRRAKCRKILKVEVERGIHRQRWWRVELPGIILTSLSPKGRGLFGWKMRQIRAGRNAGNPDLYPLACVPENWSRQG